MLRNGTVRPLEDWTVVKNRDVGHHRDLETSAKT